MNTGLYLLELSSTIYLLITLVLISIKDINTMLIPESLFIHALVSSFGLTFINILFIGWYQTSLILIEHLISAIIAFLTMLSIKLIGDKLIKKESLGLADVKLSCVGGAWLGSNGIYEAMFFAFILGAIYSLYKIAKHNLNVSECFPFCPFISIGIFYMWINSIKTVYQV